MQSLVQTEEKVEVLLNGLRKVELGAAGCSILIHAEAPDVTRLHTPSH